MKPGIKPKEYKVLIFPEVVEEVTKGGIILPDQNKDEDKFAQQRGTIVDMSPLAFNYDNYPEGEAPKIGQTVYFGRYAGSLLMGNDGKEYRLCNDRDISAVIEEAA